MTEQKKAKIVVEFQARNDHELLMAINHLRFAVFDVRGRFPVIVNMDIPKKFMSIPKS